MKPLDKQKNELRKVQGLIRQHRIQEALMGLERLCKDMEKKDKKK